MLMLTRYIIFAKNKHYITFTIHDKNIKSILNFANFNISSNFCMSFKIF